MIRVEGIYKSFNSSKEILSDLNFIINKNEIAVLTGPNGSGKTTLLKLLSTLITPTKGRFYIAGKSNSKKIKKEVGFLSADAQGLFGNLTGLENLEYFSAFYRKKITSQLEEWDQLPTFKEALNTPFNRCSNGMKFSLLFFKSLMHNPKVLLLDEPFTNFDIVGKAFILEQIRIFSQQGTLLIATHQPESLENLSYRKLQLQEGQIV